MERLAAGADAAAGAWLAAITVLLCENLLWAGQPAGRPSGAQVIAYYSSNGQSVTIGDLIWVSGMLALVIAAWLVAERLHGPWGILAGLLATLAAVLEIEPDRRDAVRHVVYPAGHMMYIHEPSLEALRRDLVAFYGG